MRQIINDVGYAAHGIGPLAPPEDDYIVADCGHEVYEGEEVYEAFDGRTVCPDCERAFFSRA